MTHCDLFPRRRRMSKEREKESEKESAVKGWRESLSQLQTEKSIDESANNQVFFTVATTRGALIPARLTSVSNAKGCQRVVRSRISL